MNELNNDLFLVEEEENFVSASFLTRSCIDGGGLQLVYRCV